MKPVLIAAAIGVICATVLYFVAVRRNEDRTAYALIGLLLGPIGFLLLIGTRRSFRQRWMKFVVDDHNRPEKKNGSEEKWPPTVRRLK